MEELKQVKHGDMARSGDIVYPPDDRSIRLNECAAAVLNLYEPKGYGLDSYLRKRSY